MRGLGAKKEGPNFGPRNLREKRSCVKMLSLGEARNRASDHLKTIGDGLQLYHDPLCTGSYGWVFGYESQKSLVTKCINDRLLGNAPILVDKHTQEIHTLGTAEPTKVYVNNYVLFGDPHAVLGTRVELFGWRKGARKISAARHIKSRSPLGLGRAKAAVDDCLSNKRNIVECSSVEDAAQLVVELDHLGFDARQLSQ